MKKPFGIVSIPKIPELRKRLLITLGLLVVYRIGIFIPTPGVDIAALKEFFQRAEGTLFGLFNLFSGGAMENSSIFALGVMPYITASIIMELLSGVFPKIAALKKEGELGRKKINQYARYMTVGIAFLQGMFWAISIESSTGLGGESLAISPGVFFKLQTAFALCVGTLSLMWLGEQITEKGIGNGISLIIYAGIVIRIPAAVGNAFTLMRSGEFSPFQGVFALAIMAAAVSLIVFMERSHRKIPIQYASRIMGRKVLGGASTFLPLKVNTAGVIPPIFASSLLMFPLTIANFAKNPITDRISAILSPGTIMYNFFYFVLIIFFAFFYTGVVFNPVDISENLQKWGGFIPGIRPGKNTSDFIDKILSKITLFGGIYLGVVCILPSFFVRGLNVPFWFGGTALLIAIGVAMDTVQQIESFLIMGSYDGMVGGVKMKGRRM